MKIWKWHIMTDAGLAEVQLEAKKKLQERLQLATTDATKCNQQLAIILHENVILKAQLDKIVTDIKVKTAGGARKVKRASKKPRKDRHR